MPDETKNTETATAETTQVASTEEKKDETTATATSTEKKDEKSTETTETSSTAEQETVEISRIKKDADGNYVYIVDPSDPKSMVFKGKSIDELLENNSQGMKAKDAYINKLKSQGLMADKVTRESPREIEESVAFPEKGEIIDKTLKEYKIDPGFLQFTDKEWKEYEDEHGLRKTLQAENAVRQALQVAEARYAEANVKAINDSTLDEETESVAGVLAEFGVKEEDFADTYNVILDGVYSDKANFNKQGIRKSGVIVRAALKEVKKISDGKTKETITKKTEEEIATGRTLKGAIKTEGTSRQEFKKTTDPLYKSTEDVVTDLMRSYTKK